MLERFLRYVKIHTTSKEGVDEIPSIKRQFGLANLLIQELQELGLKDASVDEHCYVIATLESNLELTKKDYTLGLFAHKINFLA